MIMYQIESLNFIREFIIPTGCLALETSFLLRLSGIIRMVNADALGCDSLLFYLVFVTACILDIFAPQF